MTISEIKRIQGIVGAAQDGIIGNDTKNKIKAYQQTLGVTADGIWGPKTEDAYNKKTNPVNQTQNQNPVVNNQPKTAVFGNYTYNVDSNGSPYGNPISSNNTQTQNNNIPAYDTSTGFVTDYGVSIGAPAIQPNDPRISATNVRDTNNNGIDDTLEAIIPGGSNSSLANLPSDVYNVVIPQLKPGTPEYENAMNNLSTAYFDVMQQQMNASNEQEQQAAKYNWEALKSYAEKNLKVALSNDATTAWDQIQNLKNTNGGTNTQGSGLQNEAVDSYLKKIRATDEVTRDTHMAKEDSDKMAYYQKYATPQEIAQLVASDPAKAKSWGLAPSDEIKNAMSYSALKAKYPQMSDEQIQRNIASVLDENGNYRSALYQKYMTGSSIGANEGTETTTYDKDGNPIQVTVKPSDTGVLDINQAKSQYQTANTPLANIYADFQNREKLGTIPKTTGADSAAATGNQFNSSVTQPVSTSKPTNGTATLDNPFGSNSQDAAKLASTRAAASAAAANLGTTPPATTTKPTTPTVTAPTTPKSTYTGSSIVDYLGSTGAASDYASRKKLAAQKGITNYTGTAAQNTQLLNSLRG